EQATRILLSGQNPYATTTLFYYPPLWMQVLFVLGRISDGTHISLAHLIQVVLTGVDVLIVALAFLFMRFLGCDRSRAWWIALIGIALNPISIFMAVEHGNFDAIVGLFALSTVYAVVAWNQSASISTWLVGCLMLGLGILAKTVPLVLAPLLLIRWRETDWAARGVGAALIVLPALIGVSVLYVLSPDMVASNVFHYRSVSGYFGVSGLLNLVGGTSATTAYASAYPVLPLAAVLFAGFVFSRPARRSTQTIVISSVLLLMAIPALGPGYGPQYIGWILPLAVVLYAISTGPLRLSLLAFGILALSTYTVEYAVIPALGPASKDVLSPAEAQTVFRLPLFAAYLAVLASGLWTLAAARSLPRPHRKPVADRATP
ncbi:MAG TPA: glycosyltransferase 87 family protein, partial [Candidatus Dormibacteraeota bacterium]|nr:glycosyltransferase 87 family protein [Candidatus Dormibacteraeota bacterium]